MSQFNMESVISLGERHPFLEGCHGPEESDKGWDRGGQIIAGAAVGMAKGGLLVTRENCGQSSPWLGDNKALIWLFE